MSDHVHTCAICDGYWTCENACSYPENAECYDCLRQRRSKAEDQEAARLIAEVDRLRDLLREAHREIATIKAISDSTAAPR